MTFIISPNGVSNTSDTTVKFGSVGSVKVGGSFSNSGNVEVDINAKLEIFRDIINSGSFEVKDYSKLALISLIKDASEQLKGVPREILTEVSNALKNNNVLETKNGLSKFKSNLVCFS